MPVLSAASAAAAAAADPKLVSTAAAAPLAAGLHPYVSDIHGEQRLHRQEPRIVSLDSEDDGDGDDEETRLQTGDTSLSDGSTAGKLPSLPSIQSLLGIPSGTSCRPVACSLRLVLARFGRPPGELAGVALGVPEAVVACLLAASVPILTLLSRTDIVLVSLSSTEQMAMAPNPRQINDRHRPPQPRPSWKQHLR